MDLMMPNLDGIQATRQISAEVPGVHVLVLTSFAADDKVFPAIKAGALGYILKDTGPAELVQAIHQVHAGSHRWSRASRSRCYTSCPTRRSSRSRPTRLPPASWRCCAWWPRAQQQGDCRRAGDHRADRAHARQQYFGQTAAGQPHPGRAVRAEGGAGVAGRRGHSRRSIRSAGVHESHEEGHEEDTKFWD